MYPQWVHCICRTLHLQDLQTSPSSLYCAPLGRHTQQMWTVWVGTPNSPDYWPPALMMAQSKCGSWKLMVWCRQYGRTHTVHVCLWQYWRQSCTLDAYNWYCFLHHSVHYTHIEGSWDMIWYDESIIKLLLHIATALWLDYKLTTHNTHTYISADIQGWELLL